MLVSRLISSGSRQCSGYRVSSLLYTLLSQLMHTYVMNNILVILKRLNALLVYVVLRPIQHTQQMIDLLLVNDQLLCVLGFSLQGLKLFPYGSGMVI